MNDFDVIILGSGISGLWLLNVLSNAGFSILLVESSAIGGVQTIASQGMIHGGQKYMLGAKTIAHAQNVAALPKRWDLCLSGNGDIDLKDCRILSDDQMMWPAGGSLDRLALTSSSLLLQSKATKLLLSEYPQILANAGVQPIYRLPEKVLDVYSLVNVLSKPHAMRIYKGDVTSLSRSGDVSVSGHKLKAQVVICAAGLGNERFLQWLDPNNNHSQRRPLRQLMVKTMDYPLFGHAITTSPRPRVTVTSYPLRSGGYVWYLGGSVAEETLSLNDSDAVDYAKKEMLQIFGDCKWDEKQWSTWYGVRAESYSRNGQLPDSPVVQEYGSVLVTWPTKLTFAPLMGDTVLLTLKNKGIVPSFSSPDYSGLSLHCPPYAKLPWHDSNWLG